MQLRIAMGMTASAVAIVALAAGLAGQEWWASAQAPPKAEAPPPDGARMISALGRLEPDDGVIRIGGPSHFAVVIGRLFVDDGDTVRAGQTIAELDNHAVTAAVVAQLEAEMRHAQAEWKRQQTLRGQGVVSSAEYEAAETRLAALRAQRDRAAAELEMTLVRSPIDGEVLEVHARAGEKVGPDGIAELGRTQRMMAIAEVYETDIGRVQLGQRATISSPALAVPVHGAVHRIARKIGKKDVLSIDPAAKTDARVVEVEILLEDAPQVAGLTNLEVDVVISP